MNRIGSSTRARTAGISATALARLRSIAGVGRGALGRASPSGGDVVGLFSIDASVLLARWSAGSEMPVWTATVGSDAISTWHCVKAGSLLFRTSTPARLVAPGRRGYHWVKWVTAIELSERPPWWQPPLPLQ
jgi:hypothetical protein